MRATGEARPSETEAAEKSKLHVPLISVEESKGEEKTFACQVLWQNWLLTVRWLKHFQIKR